MILERVMYFHLGFGLLVVSDVLHRFFLPVELDFLTSCVWGVFSIEGDEKLCVINQGISHTEVVLH